jgi:hypothetical protein
MLPALRGIPTIDLNRHVTLALHAGRSASAIALEALRLMRGPGKLSGSEYFYYRLWDEGIDLERKRQFVGRKAQTLMHVTCNDRHWYQTAADKVLFQTIMTGAGLPVPEMLAVTQRLRWLPHAETLSESARLAGWLRDRAIFPLFAKPAGGKYSLNVLSIDRFEPNTDGLILLGGGTISVERAVEQMLGGNGYILQKRLAPDLNLAKQYGPRLWSVRALVLVRPDGPIIHRALVKIATGVNPADNYWRAGNMLAALDAEGGQIMRAVRGAGADLAICQLHPDTNAPLVGATLPNWPDLRDLVLRAACVFPGIRTQSWDVALTDRGPVLLEVNYGGDLNLAQLAEGRGVLDETYREHLSACGYPL